MKIEIQQEQDGTWTVIDEGVISNHKLPEIEDALAHVRSIYDSEERAYQKALDDANEAEDRMKMAEACILEYCQGLD